MDQKQKTAIIIGAGPAGLTAAFELLAKTDIKPIIFEQTSDIGGISKTVNYKGNRIDIGGHRFFSKSDRVMSFWLNILPMEQIGTSADPQKIDKVMLLRQRLSRILFLRKFFDYPISLTLKTVKNLGVVRMLKIGLSYMKAQVFKIKEEKSLEDFLINRFGRELYNTFFKDYTEKVWGVSCSKIKPEWGAQRIKGLSITKAIIHAVKAIIKKDPSIGQKEIETSLISQFLYPKFGPGQLWEAVADIVKSKGGQIFLNHKAIGINLQDNKIISVRIKNEETGEQKECIADYIFSTMPVKDLIEAIKQDIPETVRKTASGLCYRDFITVGLLVKKLKIKNDTQRKTINNIVPDNWIYIQEPDVRIGRLQIFNNWSPYMVADENNAWLGLEYFCNQGDDLWNIPDEKFKSLAIGELAKIGIIDFADVLDSVVIRIEKTYPAYFGSYDNFDIVKNYLNRFENLFLIGRNGMHRYNNQDHSMLTAMTAVENIASGITTKENIWKVNAEEEYHEKKITAVENITDAYVQTWNENPGYNPDIYWSDTGIAYPYYPTVRHRKRFILNELKKSGIDSNTFIFAYGCGEGSILSEIKRVFDLRDSQFGGYDISIKAVEIAKQKLGSLHLYSGIFSKLPRECNFIICSEVIEHTKDYSHILNLISSNLTPGGKVILTTQTGKVHASDRYTGHTQHFEITHLIAILTHLGFEIEKAQLWGFPFFTLQKYLTNIGFEKIKQNYLEGNLTLRKKIVFEIANLLFYLHDFIKFGPQIYIVAKKK